jgi:hypothetical protein
MPLIDPSPPHQSHRHKRRLRAPMQLSMRNAIVLSILVLLGGCIISYEFSDWSWFSRSGSLVVVIGIFLTSSQVIENNRRLKSRRHYREQNFTRDYAEDMKRQTLARSRSLDEDIWASGLRGLYLLVTGTVVWGFGDLVVVLF